MSLRAPLAPRFDPGWLYVVPGAAIVAATVLVPAHDDLAEARWRLAQAEAIAAHRVQRLENYSQYLDAVDRADTAVVMDLAATQLNLVPADRKAILTAADRPRRSASVFPALEPAPPKHTPDSLPSTLLRRLTTSDHTRLWVVAAGMVAILYGLITGLGRQRP